MANLDEAATWEAVLELETDDDVLGGPGGTANIAPQQLTHRTSYLKDEAERVEAIGALAFMQNLI